LGGGNNNMEQNCLPFYAIFASAGARGQFYSFPLHGVPRIFPHEVDLGLRNELWVGRNVGFDAEGDGNVEGRSDTLDRIR
jgi:hypothetical protein